VAKLDDSEIAANRGGASNDAKADAAVRFACKVAQLRGHVSDEDVRALQAAGYSDGEIVQHVALNTWTNYVNSVAHRARFPGRYGAAGCVSAPFTTARDRSPQIRGGLAQPA
jgi:alkylhydroperoxidase family enzyme